MQRQGEGSVNIEDVQHRGEIMQQKRHEVRKLETWLREYHQLPPNLESSRGEVRRAQAELEGWIRGRGDSFREVKWRLGGTEKASSYPTKGVVWLPQVFDGSFSSSLLLRVPSTVL